MRPAVSTRPPRRSRHDRQLKNGSLCGTTKNPRFAKIAERGFYVLEDRKIQCRTGRHLSIASTVTSATIGWTYDRHQLDRRSSADSPGRPIRTRDRRGGAPNALPYAA